MIRQLIFKFQDIDGSQLTSDKINKLVYLHFVSVFSSIFILIFGFYAYFSWAPIVGKFEIFFGFVIASIPFIYKLTRSLGLCSFLLMCCSYGVTLGLSALTGGADSPVISWFAIGIVYAAFLEEKKRFIYWCIVVIATSFFFIVYDTKINQLTWAIIDPHLLMNLKNRTAFTPFIFSILLSFIYHKTMETGQYQMLKQNEKINNLLRILSHDIANPLTIISLWSKKEILIKKNYVQDLSLETTQLLKEIDYHAGEMLRIISEVRNMEAYQSGKKEIKIEDISLNEIFLHQQDKFKSQLQEKNIEFTFTNLNNMNSEQNLKLNSKSDNKNDMVFIGDRYILVEKILDTLLENAIKFSFSLSRVSITSFHTKNEITFTISDEGIGIPENQIKHLFYHQHIHHQRNAQLLHLYQIQHHTNYVSTANSSSISTNNSNSAQGLGLGLGLGLIIAKFYTELLGGTIKVKSVPIEVSEEFHGSTFELTFQLISKAS